MITHLKKLLLLAAFSMGFTLSEALSQSVWTNGAGDQIWSTPGNWLGSATPNATSSVLIEAQPTGDQIALDVSVTIASLTFNSSLTASMDIAPVTLETIQVNGALTNLSTFQASFSAPFIAGSSSTWTGGGGLSFQNNVNFGTSTITLSGPIEFAGSLINFTIASSSSYGKWLGSPTLSFTGTPTINFVGTYTGLAGDVFTIFSGGFSGATLGSLPSLSPGLSWDTSEFISDGKLTVVPEPQTWALVVASLTAVTVFRRRTSRRS